MVKVRAERMVQPPSFLQPEGKHCLHVLHPRPLQPERPLVATLARPVEKTYAMEPVSDSASVPKEVTYVMAPVFDSAQRISDHRFALLSVV